MGLPARDGLPGAAAAATRAFAKRAYAAGARFHEGETAWPWVIGHAPGACWPPGVRRPAGAVLVAAGPWTPEVIDPTRAWQPIVPVWGVVAEIEMEDPPRHVLEEAGVEAVGAGGPASIFSLVRGRRAGVGGLDVPGGAARRARLGADPAACRRALRAWSAPGQSRGRTRLCAPAVGRRAPACGRAPWQYGLWVAAGHGPWGISTGPATARLVADALLGKAEVPVPLSVARA